MRISPVEMKKHIILLFTLAICLSATVETIFAQTTVELLVRAKASIDKEDYQLAIKDLTELIKLEPGNYDAFAKRAQALVMIADYNGAIADSN